MTRFLGWVSHLGDIFEEELAGGSPPQGFSAFGPAFSTSFAKAFGTP